jgi:Ca-activated chloride channel family protein
MLNRLAVLLFVLSISAFTGSAAAADPLSIEIVPLGDSDGSVATRILFVADAALGATEGAMVLQGTILHEGAVVRNFRRILGPEDGGRFQMVQLVPPGALLVEARLLAGTETAPLLLAKATGTANITLTGALYTAGDDAAADEILAEGIVPETAGSVRIREPRRDVAPNLFIVEVVVDDPVRRVEFWIDGKKLLTRNAPPYRAEVDLGSIPQRVELKVVGYDVRGRYIDSDAWIVNERKNELDVTVTRTETPDGMSHLRVSVQNPQKRALRSVALFADQERLVEWKGAPYALDLPSARLAGKDYVQAVVIDSTGAETSDLLYLDPDRYVEEIDVNLVELPVTVSDADGAPVASLRKSDFQVLEDGKPQTIESFGFATDLPLSVGVLVDHSGSMKERIEDARKAALEFFAAILREGDKAFFGGFSFDARGITPFTAEVGALQRQVLDLPAAEGGTALYDAIITGLYRFRAVPGRKALIIVTDGEDTVSKVSYEEMLRYVRAARVPIYFIGVGLGRLDFGVTGRLRSLAAETGGVAFFIGNASGLRATYEQLESELRSQYLLGYYTQSSKNDREYRKVDVKVNRAGATARTIRGFIP